MCDKEYIKKCELISHMDTHSDEARYECTICEKKYRHKKVRTHFTMAANIPQRPPIVYVVPRFFPCDGES